MTDSDFSTLLAKVRRVIERRYGPSTSVPFLMLCDLLEILERKKVDRVKWGGDEPV